MVVKKKVKKAGKRVKRASGKCVDCDYPHEKFGLLKCPLCKRCRNCGYSVRNCRCVEGE